MTSERLTRSRLRNNENELVMLYVSSSSSSKKLKTKPSSSVIGPPITIPLQIIEPTLNLPLEPSLPNSIAIVNSSSLKLGKNPASTIINSTNDTQVTKTTNPSFTSRSFTNKISTVELRASAKPSSSIFVNDLLHVNDRSFSSLNDSTTNLSSVSDHGLPDSESSYSPSFSYVDSYRLQYFLSPPPRINNSLLGGGVSPHPENQLNAIKSVMQPVVENKLSSDHDRISATEITTTTLSTSNNTTPQTCPICLELLTANNTIVTPCCDQVVCLLCTYQNISRRLRKTCFICQQTIIKSFEDTIRAKWVTEKRIRQALKRRSLDEIQKFKPTPLKERPKENE